MARCNGGQNQKGEQKSRRMHLNGDEHNCIKHQSDNFDLLSTTSRVAARNRHLALPPPVPERDGEDEDENQTDSASSGPCVISERGILPRTPGSTSGFHSSVSERSPSPAPTADNIPPLPKNHDVSNEGPDRILIAPGLQRITRVNRDDNQPPPVQQNRNKVDRSLLPTIIFLLVISMCGWYRWIFREDFQYQEDVIRDHFGLPKRNGHLY